MILKAVMLGLSTGAFCFGVCAPVFTGLLFSHPYLSFKTSLKSLCIFLFGRLSAYLLFGILSYWFGKFIQGHRCFLFILPMGEALLGMLMIIFALTQIFPHLSLCRTGTSKGILRFNALAFFSAGFLTGINICPPFLLAFAMAVQSSSIFKSLLFFFSFFLVTSLYFIPFLFSSLVIRTQTIRLAARIVCGLTGVYFLYTGFHASVLAFS